MKKNIIVITFLIVSLPLFSVTVDGYAYLEGETDHSGIEVFFQRVVPDTLFSNTVYTDASGYYSSVVEDGWYDVKYHKSDFDTILIIDIILYSNQRLTNQTLLKQGLSGSISGVLTAGVYNITGSITVVENDSLIIQPGVTLNFDTDTELIVNGYLKAEGTEIDSIYFNASTDNWGGIETSGTAYLSIQFCSIINTGTAVSITSRNGQKPKILNSYIGNSSSGIYIETNCLIENTKIKGKGSGTGIEIEHGSGNVEILHTRIDNFSTGILAWEGFLIADNVQIWVGGLGMELYNGDCLLYNSTLGVGYYGIAANLANISIFNCNIQYLDDYYDDELCGIVDGNCEVWNSNVYGFPTNYNCGDYIGVNVTTNTNADSCDAYGNISMDPLFVDATNGDFRLQTDSPCIDAGTNTITDYEFPIADLDDNYRIWDGDGNGSVIVDMGAYEYDSPTGIENSEIRIQNYTLHQNYPNPFNPETTISYSLINNAQVNLKVYDIAGREVCSLVDQEQSKGSHEVNFDGSMLTSGIYFYRLSVDGKAVESRKMMLLK